MEILPEHSQAIFSMLARREKSYRHSETAVNRTYTPLPLQLLPRSLNVIIA
jgi:hypothetical protein